MPLHLLGKKSWNVYNQENVARVRQDEAAARLAEQEAESSQQQEDAQQRLRLLRGGQEEDHSTFKEAAVSTSSPHRKRKRDQEDDPRQLSESHEGSERRTNDSAPERQSMNERQDRQGSSKQRSSRRSAAETDSGTVENLDKISNMKFRDAAGRDADVKGPWYAQTLRTEHEGPGKDVWGNEDPGRTARNQQRIAADDPLLAMKKGVRKLKDSERYRKEWMEQRERDLYEVEELARRHRKHRRRRPHEKHRTAHRHERRHS